MKRVTAIFDIGKTNKKCFLFDEAYQEVYSEYASFQEGSDEDGFPCDPLDEIVSWIETTLSKLEHGGRFLVVAVNFSTYGASLVHLGEDGRPVAPLYNYLKPFPRYLKLQFLSRYGSELDLATATASPFMGLLNSGLQLYWLKYEKPEIFLRIQTSLHLPQYLSYVFTGKCCTDYTSLGCHTMLWDFAHNEYHRWVYAEGFDRLLCPLMASDHQEIRKNKAFGVGIHDSSAALIPYIKGTEEPFVLLSTGTWNITLNPFAEGSLTPELLECDCLNFLRADGKPVRASRLFLGHHANASLDLLKKHFGVVDRALPSVKWQRGYRSKRRRQLLFDHRALAPERFGFLESDESDYSHFSDFEDALMHLFDELTDIQIASMRLAIGKTKIKRVYIDGGFGANEVFVRFLRQKLPEYDIRSSSAALGSALGAALVGGSLSGSKELLIHSELYPLISQE